VKGRVVRADGAPRAGTPNDATRLGVTSSRPSLQRTYLLPL